MQQYTRGSIEEAVRIAASDDLREQAVTALRSGIYAVSTRASLLAREKQWDRVARAAGYENPFELSKELIFTVRGALSAAGFRSASIILVAARKRFEVQGGTWGPAPLGLGRGG